MYNHSFGSGSGGVVKLSACGAEQKVWDSSPGLARKISELGYLLRPSRDMVEILCLKAT